MRRERFLPISILALLLTLVQVSAFGERPSPEDLLEFHVRSVGDVGKWRALQSVRAEGSCRLTLIVGGSGTLLGRASFVSQGTATAMRLDFGHGEYAGEAIVFDGGKQLDVAYATPGHRSMLGEFLFSYSEVVKDGLLGGVLSRGWPLLQDEKVSRRLTSRGKNTSEGREWWQATYRPRKGPRELDVDLFFEPDTFLLRKSEYEVRRSYGMGPFPGVPSASQAGQAARRDVRMKMEELFDDYVDVQGVTFPRRWKIRCTNETNDGTTMWEWDVEFTRFELGGPVDPAEFRLK